VTDHDNGDELARRDQLLELLYWIEGEGFAGAAQIDALARFLAQPVDTVSTTLDDLVRRGEVSRDSASGDYKLTQTGHREGARRFADDFAPLLSQGHGECNDSACECHSDPLAASECHRQRRGP
jgi:DNA-binding IclR family transcriptional regulator